MLIPTAIRWQIFDGKAIKTVIEAIKSLGDKSPVKRLSRPWNSFRQQITGANNVEKLWNKLSIEFQLGLRSHETEFRCANITAACCPPFCDLIGRPEVVSLINWQINLFPFEVSVGGCHFCRLFKLRQFFAVCHWQNLNVWVENGRLMTIWSQCENKLLLENWHVLSWGESVVKNW